MDMCAGSNCWNEDAGGICIGCGCCSEYPVERCEARIAVLEERIFDLEHDMRSPHKEFDFEQDAWVQSAYDYATPENMIEDYERQIEHYRRVRSGILASQRVTQRSLVPA